MSADVERRLFVLSVGTPSRLLSVTTGGCLTTVIDDLGGAPDGIAVDHVNGRIFWTNMGTERDGEDFPADDGFIESSDFDGGDRRVIVGPGVTTTPKQIQCDPRGGFIYWCDREGMRVWRARLDGSEPTVLVRTGSTARDREDRRRHCVGVAVDTVAGHLFWTQKGRPDGGEGAICRAPLEPPAGVEPDGRTDIEIFLDALPEPIDLELSDDCRWLYWTDRGLAPEGNTLNRAAVGRSSPPEREIVAGGLREAIGLALDEGNGRAFVSDLSGDLRVVDLGRPGATGLIRSIPGPVTGIALAPAS